MLELIKHNLDNLPTGHHYIHLVIPEQALENSFYIASHCHEEKTAIIASMINLNRLDEIHSILQQSTSIAVIGLSPKEHRPSNMVARYLIEAGYTIYPVNPGQKSILGLPCYPSLSAISAEIDIVDIFRNKEHIMPIVNEAVYKNCSTVWMQQGIVHHQAAQYARENGLQVIMDRCIKIDHANLFGQQSLQL